MKVWVLLCTVGGVWGALGDRLTAEYHRANRGTMWAAFKAAHRKVYKDPAEEATREAVYHMNMDKAVALQAQNPHARFGGSVFADQTPAEMQALGKGHIHNEDALATVARHAVEPQRYLQAILDIHRAKRLDWVQAGAVTPVKSQGTCNSCWAFSTVAALESQWAIKGHGLVSLSEEQFVECVNGQHTHQCDAGVPVEAYTYMLENFGGKVTTEEASPFRQAHYKSGDDLPTCPGPSGFPTAGAEFTGFHRVAGDEVAMYAALEDVGPLQVAVAAESWQTYTGGILTECSAPGVAAALDHAVLLVGYGYDTETRLSYWIVKNSWSAHWGEAGYIRLQYGTNQCRIADAGGLYPVVKDGIDPIVLNETEAVLPDGELMIPECPSFVKGNTTYTLSDEAVCKTGNESTLLGKYNKTRSTADTWEYTDGNADGCSGARSAVVAFRCCSAPPPEAVVDMYGRWVTSVKEAAPCRYVFDGCKFCGNASATKEGPAPVPEDREDLELLFFIAAGCCAAFLVVLMVFFLVGTRRRPTAKKNVEEDYYYEALEVAE
eukprot:TRINITY_DN3583_c0_g1_i1.p1 TRINITY_DN3583_c0_g1~~TRINITY_DN3583_c0_g1_i1.p1  ORF type:complete len:548 (+),score=119.68 TRINITY_DN3583_c0_g1_i1:52-1695(+)